MNVSILNNAERWAIKGVFINTQKRCNLYKEARCIASYILVQLLIVFHTKLILKNINNASFVMQDDTVEL